MEWVFDNWPLFGWNDYQIIQFQPQCASLRITDCAQLAREWPRDAILRDEVCNAQCGLVLQNTRQRDIASDLRPPPQRVARSRSSGQQQQRQRFNFQGFRFPDLTQFIAWNS